jgi:GMP synthase-like glutamine amidotransferase
MKPIAIFRFSIEDGPGYFASFLARHTVPWQLFKIDEGEALPSSALDRYAGCVFMGGPMSVNDDLPWIMPVLELIRNAVDRDLPCLGHCLGGQLMSRALGGTVTVNHVKEIGWNEMQAVETTAARDWLGENAATLTTFQWHGETFSIPSGATRILTSKACVNQAFVLGKSLALQCHIEMTAEMVADWCGDWQKEEADPSLASIQTPSEMLAETAVNLPRLNHLADQLYTRWLEGVNRENY